MNFFFLIGTHNWTRIIQQTSIFWEYKMRCDLNADAFSLMHFTASVVLETFLDKQKSHAKCTAN